MMDNVIRPEVRHLERLEAVTLSKPWCIIALQVQGYTGASSKGVQQRKMAVTSKVCKSVLRSICQSVEAT